MKRFVAMNMYLRKRVGFALVLLICLIASLQAARTWGSSSARERIRATGGLSVRRFSQTATLLPNGKVLIAGGMEQNGVYYASTELYDLSTGRFTVATSMESARACHTATLLQNNKVLIAGGSDGSWHHLATAELYDPATGKFTPTGNLTTARCGAEAALLNDGRVLIAGGMGEHEYDRLASTELYNPATGTFAKSGSMHVPRDAHAIALLLDGRVLVVGGSTDGRFPNETLTASAELYDPATGRFTVTANMAIPRYKHAAVTLADGRVLVAGGSDNRAWRGKYASAELYDPSKGTFSPAGEMNFKRFKIGSGAVRLSNGRVLIGGGAEQPELFDPASNSFRVVAGSVGDGRYFSTVTPLSDGEVLIVGGYGENPGAGGVATAWLYKP
jgi:hypothetical protein